VYLGALLAAVGAANGRNILEALRVPRLVRQAPKYLIEYLKLSSQVHVRV